MADTGIRQQTRVSTQQLFVSARGPSSSSSTGSPRTGRPGKRYSSLTHLLRSTSLQRSEQNGRNGLSCHSTCLLQVGHFFMSQMGRRLIGERSFTHWAQQPFRALDQNSSVNEVDRTFPAHRVQAHRHALTRGSHDGSDFPVRQGNID